MRYFSIEELTRSNVAGMMGIDNSAGDVARDNLTALAEAVLDPLREAWGKAIRVNSGYRCEALNRAVDGSKTSHHLEGKAADITAGSKASNRELFKLAQSLNLPYCQLIDESKYSWIHVSYDKDNIKREVLHL